MCRAHTPLPYTVSMDIFDASDVDSESESDWTPDTSDTEFFDIPPLRQQGGGDAGQLRNRRQNLEFYDARPPAIVEVGARDDVNFDAPGPLQVRPWAEYWIRTVARMSPFTLPLLLVIVVLTVLVCVAKLSCRETYVEEGIQALQDNHPVFNVSSFAEDLGKFETALTNVSASLSEKVDKVTANVDEIKSHFGHYSSNFVAQLFWQVCHWVGALFGNN